MGARSTRTDVHAHHKSVMTTPRGSPEFTLSSLPHSFYLARLPPMSSAFTLSLRPTFSRPLSLASSMPRPLPPTFSTQKTVMLHYLCATTPPSPRPSNTLLSRIERVLHHTFTFGSLAPRAHPLQSRASCVPSCASRAPLSTLCNVLLPFGAVSGFLRRFTVRPWRSDSPYSFLEDG